MRLSYKVTPSMVYSREKDLQQVKRSRPILPSWTSRKKVYESYPDIMLSCELQNLFKRVYRVLTAYRVSFIISNMIVGCK